MIRTFGTIRVPLQIDPLGTVLIGGSHVSLDTVVRLFEAGVDPIAIVRAYPALTPADLYAVIAWYLRHQEQVAEYLREREAGGR
jgi:uncharacterized protein (DUF433 family)